MDTERLQLLWDNLKSFLTRKVSREALVFAFFFVVSASFWLLQTLHEEYEMDLRVPMSLKNVPDETVVTEELPSMITLKVRDRGSSLIGYYFSYELRHGVEIDFTEYDRGENFGHVVLSLQEIQKLLGQFLQGTTRILTVHPDTIDYYFTRGVQKRLPVVFRGHVDTSSRYYLERLTLSPDSVTVWGSREVLDSLTSISTETTNISGLSETTEQMALLSVPRGIKTEPKEVKLQAMVDIYTEKQVRVPIVGTNFPAGYSLRTFPASAVITFRIGSKSYKDVTAENFVLTATYEELLAQPDSALHLQLRSIPEGISQVKIIPETVQYLIEQTGE